MDDKRIIINIGRQLGSGGRVIAERLAADFGCKFYDKELLNLAAKESGFSPKFFEQNDEQKGFLKSFFGAHVPFTTASNYHSNKISQESLFQIQSDAIRKAAGEGSCVFVGRCADYVLRDCDRAVSVFITADIKERVARVAKRFGCGEETALKVINDRESERANYYNYYTGKKWGHSASYDLCVNSTLLGTEGTAAIIEEFVRRRFGIVSQ